MAARSIRMPDVGEGVTEAEIVEWLVAVGDPVREDQIVCAVMTDKATVEIPSPVTGNVLALGGGVGDTLAVGSELVRIEAAEGGGFVAEKSPPPQPFPARGEGAAGGGASTRAEPAAERPLASPAVRLRAREAGVDLHGVRGSGPDGRIVHDDLTNHLERPAPNLDVETIKVAGLRRRIARNMAESKRRVAHFSYVEEIDVTLLEDARAALNREAGDTRPRLTLLPFLMLGMVKALAEFPQINAHYDDEEEVIRRFGAVHIGIATQTSAGLAVPVVRHAETRSLYDAAREMARVTEAARQGVAAREDLTGSTITLTSLGALGGIVSTPIVNRPEVAIVGVNRIAIRPVWRDNAFAPRKIMNLSSSFDHRVIDGHDAASFIQSLRAKLEQPVLLFVEGA